MNLKITSAYKTQIETALHAVNGSAEKHTYTSLNEIEAVAAMAEEKLASLKLPLSLRVGSVWVDTSGSSVANSYNNTRIGTKITMMRKSSGWALTAIDAATLYKEGGGGGKLLLTQTQYDEAAKRLLAGIAIMKNAEAKELALAA